MTTPEVRAREAWNKWEGAPVANLIDLVAAAIAAAEREAVEEFRERCAKIAETIEPEGNYHYNDEQGSYWESDWRKTVAEVARRIREARP